MRTLLAFAVFAGASMLLISKPRFAAIYALVYLSFLGGIRRWLIPSLGYPSNDTLLLAIPGAVILYGFWISLDRTRYHETQLSRLVRWLLVAMLIQVVNPLQGGLTVGIAGVLFYVVPILWYFVGKRAGAGTALSSVLYAAVAIALLAGAYGIWQVWVGFAPSEQLWMELTRESYGALGVRGGIRPFSFFTSSAEYTQFLSLGIVICWAFVLRGKLLSLIPIPALGLALLLSGTRGPIVLSVTTAIGLWAIQGRQKSAWLPRLAFAGVLALAGMVWSLGQVQQAQLDDRVAGLVAHQTAGLLNPLDEENSTASIHGAMLIEGLIRGVKQPIGYGLGSTTLAATKFGGNGGSTEIDVSNMFVSLGIIGGAIYAVIVFRVLQMTVRAWNHLRSSVVLGVLGALAASLGQWLNGGHYAAAMMIWFCVGALERMCIEETLRSLRARSDSLPATNVVSNL